MQHPVWHETIPVEVAADLMGLWLQGCIALRDKHDMRLERFVVGMERLFLTDEERGRGRLHKPHVSDEELRTRGIELLQGGMSARQTLDTLKREFKGRPTPVRETIQKWRSNLIKDGCALPLQKGGTGITAPEVKQEVVVVAPPVVPEPPVASPVIASVVPEKSASLPQVVKPSGDIKDERPRRKTVPAKKTKTAPVVAAAPRKPVLTLEESMVPCARTRGYIRIRECEAHQVRWRSYGERQPQQITEVDHHLQACRSCDGYLGEKE